MWNPAVCICKNGKPLASIIDNSAIICDEIIEAYNHETNFDLKKANYRTQNFYILF